ncbi:hypothetical protein NPIL_525432 [Nephila pilipes]|nr:hypothetical protein NPIL_525432 [Nephila pilipes]
MIFLEGDFTQVVMELTSGNQNLELSARKSRWSNDHELKRVIEKLCLMAAEMDTSADEFKTAVKEIDSLRLLKKSSISNPGFMKGIMNLINISENQSLEKITSMEVAVHLSGEQLNLKIKQLKRNFEKVRKIVSEKLLEKGIRTGSYAEIVPEEDENLRAPLQRSLVSSNSFVDDIFKRIDSAEKQTVDKITSSEVAAELSGTELTKKLSQSLNSYKVLRHRFEKTVANIDKIV